MARGTYPKPELKLFLIKGGIRRPAGEAGVRTFTRATPDGLFDVALHADMVESQLSSLAELLECVLEIPYSNYALTRRMSLAHELTWGAYASTSIISSWHIKTCGCDHPLLCLGGDDDVNQTSYTQRWLRREKRDFLPCIWTMDYTQTDALREESGSFYGVVKVSVCQTAPN
ncbi:hypothetical protein V5799_031156 [Amblyomma americanum]|uniref:Uncharacterized protein n=1 Tax=Amblyomma americanum TaxID=6943 RepID=A0AAQ4ELN5_AMBAM